MYLRVDFDRDFKEGGKPDILLRIFLVPFSFRLMSSIGLCGLFSLETRLLSGTFMDQVKSVPGL